METNESLDGWWHAFFDASAEWCHSELASQQISHTPCGGWDALDEHKESIPVPGAWCDRRPGFHGVVWYQRPFVLPDEWPAGQVKLRINGLHTLAQIYLDECLVVASHEENGAIEAALGRLEPGRVYELCICIWHPDDSGGIEGGVSLHWLSGEIDE